MSREGLQTTAVQGELNRKFRSRKAAELCGDAHEFPKEGIYQSL